MSSLVIGVLGRKRSGKDTFAQRLTSTHAFTRYAFADALKATMYDLDPYVPVEADELGLVYGAACGASIPRTLRLSHIVDRIGWEAAKEVREVRRLLQDHGVAIRNHVASSVWVDAVAYRVAETSGPVVITDVRFPNEVDYVHSVGGFSVRVERPGLASNDTHVSETALDGVRADFTVTNSSTIEDLHRQADAIVDRIRCGATPLALFA